MKRYSHKYRPTGHATLPAGVSFDMVEAPWDTAHLRMDLQRSERRFGVFTASRQLTADEFVNFEIAEV